MVNKSLYNADMRRVRFVQMNDHSYYRTKAETLCRYCGSIEGCPISSFKTRLPTTQCEIFMPILGFSKMGGLDQDSFNTLRLGKAWEKRVTVGSVVALCDLKTDCIIGRAKVTAIYVGSKEEIANEHGINNHLMLGLDKEKQTGAAILKVLRNAYGKIIYEGNSELTAIYLTRLD